MAYPSVHKFNAIHKDTYCSSIGGSPVAAYIRIPFRCQIGMVYAVTNGTITTADCSVAVAVNGTAVSGSAFTIPVASAGAGETATFTPTALTFVNDGDQISFAPSGASGSSIWATFSVALKRWQNERQRGDFRKVASIPLNIINTWLNEEWARGNVDLKMGGREFDLLVQRKLNDPDWRWLRTA